MTQNIADTLADDFQQLRISLQVKDHLSSCACSESLTVDHEHNSS